ncbi:MAG: 30S ribosomal protein S15 [Elusimicrobiota bacterium]
MIGKDAKAKAAEPFRLHKTDTGGTAVQVATLTARITDLSNHMTGNKKDFASRLGLLKMVGQRRRLLNYLNDSNPSQYKKVISELNLRK